MEQLRLHWSVIRNRYHTMKLSTKLVFTYAVIITIPALFITIFLTNNSERAVYKESITESTTIVEQICNKIYQNVSLLENTISIAGKQTDFLKFCNGNMNEDGLKLVKFSQNELKQMKYIFQSNDLISSASFYFYNDDLYEIWDTIYEFDRFEDMEFANEVHQKRRTIYKLDGVTQKGSQKISCYREIFIHMSPVAILEICVDPELFFEPVLYTYEKGGMPSCIIDKNRSVLISDKESELWAKINKRLPELYRTLTIDVSGQTTEWKVAEDTYYVTYQYVPAIESYVLHILSRNSMMKGIYKTKILMSTGGVLILFLLNFISSVMSKKATKPLQRILESMNKIQQGDLNALIDVVDSGGNEFDEIGRNYNMILEKISILMKENMERQLSAKNAELKALQSQINSHFLYNALESIRMMAEVERKKEIADAIVALGNLMRYSMSWKNQNVTLKEEIGSIQNYIFFVNLIHDTNVTLCTEIEKAIENQVILKMCLQPFVENAILHGMLPGNKNLQIKIQAVCEQQMLILKLTDNGAGIDLVRLEQLRDVLEGNSEVNLKIGRNGIGIENVHRRIQMNYGFQYGITIMSIEGKYTKVQLRTPLNSEKLGGW